MCWLLEVYLTFVAPARAAIQPLMGSVGDAYGDTLTQSFVSTLETELLSRCRFASQAEARIGGFSDIEGWYKRQPSNCLAFILPVA